MDVSDDDDGGGDSEVLAQPSFNDRLTINDFPAVSGGVADAASMAPTVADMSPAAVSLHTPTPPIIGDSDEAQFNFELVTSSSGHYELYSSPSITTSSELISVFFLLSLYLQSMLLKR